MSDESETLTLTRAELKEAIDESFLNGTRAAMMLLRSAIDDFEERLAKARPGDVDGAL